MSGEGIMSNDFHTHRDRSVGDDDSKLPVIRMGCHDFGFAPRRMSTFDDARVIIFSEKDMVTLARACGLAHASNRPGLAHDVEKLMAKIQAK